MSSRNNQLLGFPLKVFVKSEQFKESQRKQTRDTTRPSESGEQVRQFYESLPAASSTHQPQPSAAAVPATRPKKRATRYSLNQLFQGVSSNDIRLVTDALTTSHGKEVLTCGRDRYGWTALMVASFGGRARLTGMLLRHGADPSASDKAGNTCLSLAAKAGHTEVTDVILAGGSKKTRSVTAKATAKKKPGHCDICEEDVPCLRTHQASTTHRLKAEMADGGPKAKAYYGIARSNRGFQMMVRNDGWDPDSGLGKESEGKLYPVKTTLKRDRKGLGAEGVPGPRVTHFGPFDQSSVETGKEKVKRQERLGTQDRMKRKKKETKQTRNEIDFRREFM